MIKYLALGAACAALAACANRPESIHADFVSYERYTGLKCPELADKLADTRAALADASRAQDGSANGDALGVLIVGIPPSKLMGDHEAEVARHKGEVEAIETAQIKGGCKPA